MNNTINNFVQIFNGVLDKNKLAQLSMLLHHEMIMYEYHKKREEAQKEKELVNKVLSRISVKLNAGEIKELRDMINSLGR